MQVAYNLKYRKANFHNRIILQKEGEIVLQEGGFRLKGKGAADLGEFIHFSDIKELYVRTTSLAFVTFAKDRYTLCEAGSLFDDLIKDFFKVRNDYISEALFMRQGEHYMDFDGHFERYNRFEKLVSKGQATFKLYEESMVIVPEKMNAFPVHFHFINFHEFDDMDYKLKIVMSDGSTVFISQLGNVYDDFEEAINKVLANMYEYIIHYMKDLLYSGNAEALLKIINSMKGGRTMQLNKVKKVDEEVYQKLLDTGFLNEASKEYFEFFKNAAEGNADENLHIGIGKPNKREEKFIPWILWADPSKNIVAFSFMPSLKGDEIDSNSPKSDIYFFKIIMERGKPDEKVKDKILEIEKAISLLHFDSMPIYADRREIRKTKYKYAIRKLPFLRILRKSFVGKLKYSQKDFWDVELKKILAQAKI